MTATNNIQLSYLEDTGLDGNKLYTPKEWTERFRHYVKRIHDFDNKQIISEAITPTGRKMGQKRNQKSDKITSGSLDRQQSRFGRIWKTSATQIMIFLPHTQINLKYESHPMNTCEKHISVNMTVKCFFIVVAFEEKCPTLTVGNFFSTRKVHVFVHLFSNLNYGFPKHTRNVSTSSKSEPRKHTKDALLVILVLLT